MRADGLAFCIIGLEERGASEPLFNVGDFPGKIVGVLNASVAAEAVGGRVAVDCIT
jgi:hypothetical protein